MFVGQFAHRQAKLTAVGQTFLSRRLQQQNSRSKPVFLHQLQATLDQRRGALTGPAEHCRVHRPQMHGHQPAAHQQQQADNRAQPNAYPTSHPGYIQAKSARSQAAIPEAEPSSPKRFAASRVVFGKSPRRVREQKGNRSGGWRWLPALKVGTFSWLNPVQFCAIRSNFGPGAGDGSPRSKWEAISSFDLV